MTVGTVFTDNQDLMGVGVAVRASANVGAGFSEMLTAGFSGTATDLDMIFEAAAQKYNISSDLLKAVAKVESNFRPEAVSRAGAMGVMQLMPATARGLGVTDAFDPYQNIMGGAKYLRQMLDRYDGDLNLALAAYNAGPGTVSRHGDVPSFTQNYIDKVMRNYGTNRLTAGTVNYAGRTVAAPSSQNIRNTLSPLMLVSLIEMQLKSPDSKKSFF